MKKLRRIAGLRVGSRKIKRIAAVAVGATLLVTLGVNLINSRYEQTVDAANKTVSVSFLSFNILAGYKNCEDSLGNNTGSNNGKKPEYPCAWDGNKRNAIANRIYNKETTNGSRDVVVTGLQEVMANKHGIFANTNPLPDLTKWLRGDTKNPSETYVAYRGGDSDIDKACYDDNYAWNPIIFKSSVVKRTGGGNYVISHYKDGVFAGERNCATWAHFEHIETGVPFYVVNVHLTADYTYENSKGETVRESRQDVRVCEVKLISTRINGGKENSNCVKDNKGQSAVARDIGNFNEGEPVILMGDFNAGRSESEVLAIVNNYGFTYTGQGESYATADSGSIVDYIFVKNEVSTTFNVGTNYANESSIHWSDHKPVYVNATFRVVGKPSSPNLTSANAVSVGSGQIALSWSKPDDNWSAIKEYQVQCSTSSKFGEGNKPAVAVTTTNMTFTGLTNGTLYYCHVRAINGEGYGAWSNVLSATPYTTPAAPTLDNVIAGNGQIELRWTASANNGGSSITGYTAQCATDSGFDNVAKSATVSSSPVTFTGLAKNTQYYCRISATNARGTTRSATKSATTYTTPVAPVVSTVTSGDSHVILSWAAPTGNGGSSVTGYKVQYKAASSQAWLDWSHAGTGTSATITGLTNGTQYNFQVAAITAVGQGSFSSVASATPREATTYSVPGKPTLPTAAPSNGQVALSWTAPDNGNSAITGYKVQYKPTGSSSWQDKSHAGTGLSTNITGLVNGTSYDFRILAINAVGNGEWSDAATASPYTKAAAPNFTTIEVGNEQITLLWSAPTDNGGRTITGYKVQYKPSSSQSWQDWSHANTGTQATITGLTNGVQYDFQAAAITVDAGEGYFASVSATPQAAQTPTYTAPSAPIVNTSTAEDGQVVLSWAAPNDDGGSSVTGYKVQYKPASSQTWQDWSHAGTGTSTTITGLTNGTEYDFQVAAINGVGQGNFSAIANATPQGAQTPGGGDDGNGGGSGNSGNGNNSDNSTDSNTPGIPNTSDSPTWSTPANLSLAAGATALILTGVVVAIRKWRG
jgi:endonuclease/exonuclease/phosphatase family metal-dependent hydrolase